MEKLLSNLRPLFICLCLLIPVGVCGQKIIERPKSQTSTKKVEPQSSSKKSTTKTTTKTTAKSTAKNSMHKTPSKPRETVVTPLKNANFGNPLTQWFLVDAEGNNIPLFRDAETMAQKLKTLGFTSRYTDGEDGYGATLKASRNGTSLKVEYYEDSTCTINFKNQSDLNDFVNSLINSHWEYDGTTYWHPNNDGPTGMGAKVKGLTVTIVSYWEGPTLNILD